MTLFCGLFAAVTRLSNRAPDDNRKVRRGRLAVLWIGSDEYSRGVRVCLGVAAGVLLLAYGFVAATEISYLRWFVEPARIQHETWRRWFSSWWDWLSSWNGLSRLLEAGSCVAILVALLSLAVWCWGFSIRAWRVARVLCIFTGVSLCILLYWDRFPLHFVYRLVHVSNGVSPVVPTVLLSLGLLWYAYSHLNRIRLCRSRPAGLPSFEGDIYLGGLDGLSQTGGLEKAHQNVTAALKEWWPGLWFRVALCTLFGSLLLLGPWRIASVETFPFEWPYTAGLCLLYAGMLFACARFLHAWLDLRRILRMLERHPFREAFKRLPKEVSPSAVWRWGGGRQTYLTLAHSVDRLRALTERHQHSRFDHDHDFDYGGQLTMLEQGAQQMMAADSSVRPVEGEGIRCAHSALVSVSNHLVQSVLIPYWQKGVSGELQPVALAAAVAASSGTSLTIQQPPSSPSDVSLAEEFVALRFVALIRYLTLQLKNLLEFVAGALILVVVSLNSYPFEPHHSIITVISICFFAIGAVFLTAFVQMNRNTIVSYLNDSTPGKLDSDLFHILSIGALPLVTILGSQFPSIGRFMFSWLKPALETLR